MKWFWEAPHDCSVHGHMFEPRYHYEGPKMNGNSNFQFDNAEKAEKLLRACGNQTYIKDICVYCGTVIENKQETFLGREIDEDGELK